MNHYFCAGKQMLSPQNYLSRSYGCKILDSIKVRRNFSFWPWTRKQPPVEFSIVIPDGKVQKPDISVIPDYIPKPPYIFGKEEIPIDPIIWDEPEISKIHSVCKLARKTLDYAGSLIMSGVSTEEIDDHTREFILSHGAYPSPLGFNGFPKSISCSVNNVAAHGIPDARQLQDGDIINIDITVFLNGFHGDCSQTFGVGKIDEQAKKLISVTNKCLDIGIETCKDGVAYRNIGSAIDKHCKANKLATIQYLVGHGIGPFFHGPPDIYHCLNSYPGRMKAGMIFTVEPCVTERGRLIRCLDDGFTLLTQDYCRTAQAEHTILVTHSKPVILTAES
eukprot:TRINITY_DN10280_c0_g1_i4.p1 TRINITY_DN10280_c0_g1~~TRINITY_DN10280_c0_g1_i4.p1  ORF type:complete len:334 (-),score=48.88 TRINITY_DN10280_c0_g1_i4:556-1557(-)